MYVLKEVIPANGVLGIATPIMQIPMEQLLETPNISQMLFEATQEKERKFIITKQKKFNGEGEVIFELRITVKKQIFKKGKATRRSEPSPDIFEHPALMRKRKK